MDEDEKKRIRHLFRKIKENVIAKDIVDYLISKRVLTQNEMTIVLHPMLTPEASTSKLLRILFQKRGSLVIFCDALTANGMNWLVVEIMGADVTEVSDERVPELDDPEFEELTRQIMGKLSSDLETVKSLMEKFDARMNESRVAIEDEVDHADSKHYKDYLKRRVKGYQRRSLPTFTEVVAVDLAIDIIMYIVFGANQMPPPKTKYAATARKMTDDLMHMSQQTFESMIYRLRDQQMDSIKYLYNVGDEMFRDQQYNWGRIVVLYAFAGWLAKHGLHQMQGSHQDVLEFTGDIVGHYVWERLGQWIDSSGGWDAFVEFADGQAKSGQSWVPVLLGIGVLGVAAAAITRK